jgi:hypothetical protein
MRRSPGSTARVVLSLGLLAGALSGCGPEDAAAPTLEIGFARRALLEGSDRLALYFYDGGTSCTAVRAVSPRAPSLHGPYAVRLDDDARSRGVRFALSDIRVGTYVVLLDALDPAGALTGVGCAEGQRVIEGQLSRIRLTVDAPP